MECRARRYEFVKHSKRTVEILQQVVATVEKRFVRRHSRSSSVSVAVMSLSSWDFHSIATRPNGQAESMDRSYTRLTQQALEYSQ